MAVVALGPGLIIVGVAPSAAAGVAVPVCSTATASAPVLGQVATRFVAGPVSPFGVAVSANGKDAFVADTAGALFWYALRSTTLVTERKGAFRRGELLGVALTPNGRYLVAADDGGGATVFNIRQVEKRASPSSSWIRGTLTSAGQGAIEVATSPDSQFAFVTLEDSDELAVFNLKKALAHGFRSSDLVGTVGLGVAPVGMAVSPSGRYLYVTSERRTPGIPEGVLTTIDLKKAERSPSHAVVSNVTAGCGAVRVVATRSSVYVTARESDALLQFSAADLVSDPSVALQGEVRVGEAPVGLAVVDHATTVVVADSNRFAAQGTGANLAVVTGASDGHLTLVGYVKSGFFPRDMTVSRNGRTLLVSNFGSGQVETVDVSQLP